MQPTTYTLEAAFEILANTVNDFYLRGRPCLGATLKPKLHGLGIDEKSFQFNKFLAFLQAAQTAGYVKLSKTVGGDIAIAPATTPAPPIQPAPTQTVLPLTTPAAPSTSLAKPNVPLRVRPDLWNAFNSHTDNWVYDPEQDRAFRADTETWAASSTSLVGVPAGHGRVSGWMRAFAEQQEPAFKALLTTRLDQGVDAYQFANLVRNNGLHRSWQRFHIQRLLDAVDQWAREYNLHLKNVAAPFRTPAFNQPPPASPIGAPAPVPPAPQQVPVSSELNRKLETLIDHLIDDLIRLRGLLAITGPKHS